MNPLFAALIALAVTTVVVAVVRVKVLQEITWHQAWTAWWDAVSVLWRRS